jgi:hypothetical protein
MLPRPAAVCASLVVLVAAAARAEEPSATFPPPPAPPSSAALPTVEPTSEPGPTADEPVERAAEPTIPVAMSPSPTSAPLPVPPSAAPPPVQTAEADPGAAPPADWRIVGYLGGFGDGNEEGGVTVGGSFQYRAGALAGGALLETGGSLFGYSYAGAALLGGLGVRPSRNFRFDVLGEFGVHAYSGVGRDWLFGSDPGAHGSTPYAGGRATLSYLFGKRLGRFELGVYGDLQDDLTRTRHRYDYPARGSGWFSGGGTGDHVIGTSRLGFGIELGGTHDVL